MFGEIFEAIFAGPLRKALKKKAKKWKTTEDGLIIWSILTVTSVKVKMPE